jgi:hypothetical protein
MHIFRFQGLDGPDQFTVDGERYDCLAAGPEFADLTELAGAVRSASAVRRALSLARAFDLRTLWKISRRLMRREVWASGVTLPEVARMEERTKARQAAIFTIKSSRTSNFLKRRQPCCGAWRGDLHPARFDLECSGTGLVLVLSASQQLSATIGNDVSSRLKARIRSISHRRRFTMAAAHWVRSSR